MSRTAYLLLLAGFMMVLIPFVPQILRLRINAHRMWGRSDRADWQTKNFESLVKAIRLTIVAIVIVTAFIALTGR